MKTLLLSSYALWANESLCHCDMHFSSDDLPLSSFLKWMPVHHFSSPGCGGGAISSLTPSSLVALAAACALRAQFCITFLVTADARLLATWAAVVFTPCLATVSTALAAAAESTPSAGVSSDIAPKYQAGDVPACGVSGSFPPSVPCCAWAACLSSVKLPLRFRELLLIPGGVCTNSVAPAMCAARRADLGILGLSGPAAAAERLACSPLQGGLSSAGGADAPLPCWGCAVSYTPLPLPTTPYV